MNNNGRLKLSLAVSRNIFQTFEISKFNSENVYFASKNAEFYGIIKKYRCCGTGFNVVRRRNTNGI